MKNKTKNTKKEYNAKKKAAKSTLTEKEYDNLRNLNYSYKETVYENIKKIEEKPSFNKLEKYNWGDIIPNVKHDPKMCMPDEYIQEYFTRKMPMFFILKKANKKYLIKTEGFNYARYIAEIN